MRSTWTFACTTAEIKAAVHTKINHHLGQAEVAGKDLSKANILIEKHEGTPLGSVHSIRGDKCIDRIEEHTKMVDEFMRWKTVLGRLPEDTSLEIDIDDVDYFGL